MSSPTLSSNWSEIGHKLQTEGQFILRKVWQSGHDQPQPATTPDQSLIEWRGNLASRLGECLVSLDCLSKQFHQAAVLLLGLQDGWPDSLEQVLVGDTWHLDTPQNDALRAQCADAASFLQQTFQESSRPLRDVLDSFSALRMLSANDTDHRGGANDATTLRDAAPASSASDGSPESGSEQQWREAFPNAVMHTVDRPSRVIAETVDGLPRLTVIPIDSAVLPGAVLQG